MEPVGVPDGDPPPRHGGDELDGGVAVPTDPQILHHQNGRPVLRAEEPQGDGQLLAVERQPQLPFPRIIAAHRRSPSPRVRHVPGLFHLPQQLRQEPADLPRPRVGGVVRHEHVDPLPQLDPAAAGALPHRPVPHHPAHSGGFFPPARAGVHAREHHVGRRVGGLELDERLRRLLAQADVAVSPAGAEQRRPAGLPQAERHRLDQLLGFLEPPSPTEEIDHAGVVLLSPLDLELPFHGIEVAPTLLHFPGVGTGGEHGDEGDAGGLLPAGDHLSEQGQTVLPAAVLGAPRDHGVEGDGVPLRHPPEDAASVLQLPGLGVHGDQRVAHRDPVPRKVRFQRQGVQLPPLRRRREVRAGAGGADEAAVVRAEALALHLPEAAECLLEKVIVERVPGDHRVPEDHVRFRHLVKHLLRVRRPPTLGVEVHQPAADVRVPLAGSLNQLGVELGAAGEVPRRGERREDARLREHVHSVASPGHLPEQGQGLGAIPVQAVAHDHAVPGDPVPEGPQVGEDPLGLAQEAGPAVAADQGVADGGEGGEPGR